MAALSRKGFFLTIALLVTLVIGGCVSTTARYQPHTDKEKLVQSRVQLAVKYIQTNNLDRAREHLNKALEADSRSPEAHDLFALIYERLGENIIAEQYFKKALGYSPDFTRGRNNYGSFLLRQSRPEEACEQFRIGAQDLNYPRRPELYYKFGQCSLALSQREVAREAFLKATALNGQFAMASLELAEMSFDDKDYPQAKQHLNRYDQLRRGPSPRGLWLGIRLNHMFGDLDARDSQGLALKNLFPDSGENLKYRAWLKNGYTDG